LGRYFEVIIIFVIIYMRCVRVGEHTLLIDAISDLLSHVSSAAEKTMISDAVSYFTRHSRQTWQQQKVATGNISCANNCLSEASSQDKEMDGTAACRDKSSADETVAHIVAEKTATTDTYPSGDHNIGTNDFLSSQDTETDVKDVAVSADGDDVRCVYAAAEPQCSWKLLIKDVGRRKHMQHRYNTVVSLFLSQVISVASIGGDLVIGLGDRSVH